MKDEVKAQESPFTEDMIRDYRQKLTASLQEQLKNNQDLKRYRGSNETRPTKNTRYDG